MEVLKKVYIHLLIFVLIYIEFGYPMVVTELLPGSIRILIILAVAFPLVFMIRSIRIASVAMVAYTIAFVALSSIRDASLGNSILWLIPIFVGFLVANTIDFLDLVKAFNSIMVFLAGYSILTFLISVLFPPLIQQLPFLGHRLGSQATMHNAIFSVCISNATVARNYGIAWEPGAFCLLLCLSLFGLLTFEEKISKTKLFVVVCAIITTFSTMGYFCMFGIFLAFLFKRRSTNAKVRRFALIFTVAFVLLLIVLPASLTEVVFEKLSGLFSEEEDLAYTTQVRLNAIIYPFEALSSSPFIGIGYDRFVELNKTLCDGMATNTILNWFAILGMFFGIPCTWFYVKFVWRNADYAKMSLISKIILVATAILLVSTESLLRISLMYVLVFYGCGNHLRKHEQ